MAKLTMHERVHYDEASAQQMVSTGDLPGVDQVRDAAVEAHERYRPVTDGEVADYIPALAHASPDLFGICVVGVRGREPATSATPTRVLDPERLQAVRVRPGVRGASAHEAARQQLGVNGTGLPFDSVMAVELNEERTMNPMVNAGAIATTSLVPGDTAEEKWERVRDGLSRFAGRDAVDRRRRLRVRGGHQPAQPAASPTCSTATAGSTSTPTRPPTSTRGSARCASPPTTSR